MSSGPLCSVLKGEARLSSALPPALRGASNRPQHTRSGLIRTLAAARNPLALVHAVAGCAGLGGVWMDTVTTESILASRPSETQLAAAQKVRQASRCRVVRCVVCAQGGSASQQCPPSGSSRSIQLAAAHRVWAHPHAQQRPEKSATKKIRCVVCSRGKRVSAVTSASSIQTGATTPDAVALRA